MRIIIANDTYYPNIDGCSYFSQRLAAQLKGRGHTILVIAPGRTMKTGYFSHNGIDILGIRSITTFFHKDYRFSPPIFIKKKIKEAMLKFKPDIVHIQGHFFVERAVANVAHELHIPIMGTNHFMPENLTHYAHAPKRIEDWMIKVAWKQFLAVFQKLPFVTTPTKTAAAVLKKIGLKNPALPLSCGIDLKKFNPKNDSTYLRKRYGIPNVPSLISVSRLAPEKYIDSIIRAVAIAVEKTPVHLTVVGDGTERKKLEKLAHKLGISKLVTFTGYVSDNDLPNLYTLAHAFVVAGTVELQSLVTMEAMASGLPVIAADALALPELVHNGKNGYLFKPGDIKSLAEHIVKIFSDSALRHAMSQESLRIAKTHDINKTMEHFEEIYRSLIDRSKV